MPLSVQQFRQLAPEEVNPYVGILSGIQKGIEGYQAGKTFPVELQKMQIANALEQAKVPFAGQQAQADAAYKQAMAEYLMSPNKLLQNLTPEGKLLLEPTLLKQIEVTNQNRNQGNGQINNQGMYPGNQQAQFQSPEDISYQMTVNQLKTGVPEIDQQKILDTYELARFKKISDPKTREKILYAKNIDKTLDYIDPEDLTRYAGIPGRGEKFLQELSAGFGEETPEFDRYSKAALAADALSKQVRQFYGDSIQPTMYERLQKLTQPSTWKTNSKLATALFNQTKDILKNETRTYLKALESPEAYKEEPKRKSMNPNVEGQVQDTRKIGKQTMVKINNKWYYQE